MNDFDKALHVVHDALSRMKEDSGKEPRASRQSLARLVATRPPAESTPEAPAPKVAEVQKKESPAQARPSIILPAASVASAPPVPSGGAGKASRMSALRERAMVCVKCPHLASSRTQVVFGVGNIDAELMFVGEAPGADEDLQGEPFVGKAGQLLTKIIEAMGFPRSEVYIGNVLKCRPDMPPGEPGNRKPKPEEMATCLPYLIEQIEIIQPRAMVALGATAVEGLIQSKEPMNRLRGQWHEFKGIPLMVTYHPAYLLRNQSVSEKRKVWEDMLMVLERLEKPISQKQRNYFLPKG